MARAFWCGVVLGVAGYFLRQWLIHSSYFSEPFDTVSILLRMAIGPVSLGVLGVVLGLIWERKHRLGVVQGTARMLSATFYHLARVDGPVSAAEEACIREATVRGTRFMIDWAEQFGDEIILNGDMLQRQAMQSNDAEDPTDHYARALLIDLLGRLPADQSRYLLQMLIDLAACDGRVNAEEYGWLEAVQVVAYLREDQQTSRMLRAVAP